MTQQPHSRIKRAAQIYEMFGIRELAYRSSIFVGHIMRGIPPEDWWDDIAKLIDKKDPVIVDAGANEGKMIDGFLSLFADAEIHAFEPIPELHNLLIDKYKGENNVTIYKQALGMENDTKSFNVSTNLGQSSILDSSGTVDRPDGIHAGEIQRRISVDQRRLDNILNINIDMMKLDLQGYELNALKGAEGLLNKTGLVLTEVQFLPIYEDAGLFCELDEFMKSNGFQLYNLYTMAESEDGQLEFGDAIYLDPSQYSEHLL